MSRICYQTGYIWDQNIAPPTNHIYLDVEIW